MNEICKDCFNKKLCSTEKIQCKAMQELHVIQKAQNTKDRSVITRLLARKLGMRDAEPNKKIRLLGEAIINRFPELQFINAYGIKIGYVLSYENKIGQIVENLGKYIKHFAI